jgi:hypothetical protein
LQPTDADMKLIGGLPVVEMPKLPSAPQEGTYADFRIPDEVAAHAEEAMRGTPPVAPVPPVPLLPWRAAQRVVNTQHHPAPPESKVTQLEIILPDEDDDVTEEVFEIDAPDFPPPEEGQPLPKPRRSLRPWLLAMLFALLMAMALIIFLLQLKKEDKPVAAATEREELPTPRLLTEAPAGFRTILLVLDSVAVSNAQPLTIRLFTRDGRIFLERGEEARWGFEFGLQVIIPDGGTTIGLSEEFELVGDFPLQHSGGAKAAGSSVVLYHYALNASSPAVLTIRPVPPKKR